MATNRKSKAAANGAQHVNGATANGAAGSDGRKHVVVIGAGIGGCCLAARLGKLGHKVTVLEKNSFSGGRCSLIEEKGHRWDQGPSLYLMPELFEQAFADLGEDVKDHYDLKLCNPTYNIHFADGEKIRLTSNIAEMGPQLDRFERPHGVKDPVGNYISFLKEAGDHYEESVKHVLLRDWSLGPLSLLRADLIPMLIRTKALHVYRSLYGRASGFFKSSHVRQAMTFSSMYMENCKGVYYPIGGFHKVVESFETIAREKYGVEFRYNTNVRKVISNFKQPGRLSAVELEDGTDIEADVVVCNADLVWAYNNLLPSNSPYTKSLQKLEQTCSSISFYWALKEPVPELSAHNIFLAREYRESFDEIFAKGECPSKPSFYMNVPSRMDPTAAPAGKETVVVLLPCGALPQGKKPGVATTQAEMDAIIQRARKQLLQTISERINRPDFESLIEHEIINDPFTWKEKFNLYRGSILGLSHTIMQVLCFRPSTQHAHYRNLFFVGASTQPGTGVPVVVAGSKVIAEKVDRFLQGYDTSYTKEYIFCFFMILFIGWTSATVINMFPKEVNQAAFSAALNKRPNF